MKTKQLIATFALCGPLLLMNVKAQGLYFGLDLGYGFPAAKQSGFDDYKGTSNGTVLTEEYTSNSISLGKGLNVGIMAGYMFNKNVGAQLGISYLIGGENTMTYEQSVGSFSDKDEYIFKGSMIRLTPSMKIIVGESKLRPYMKAGLIIGVGGKMTEENNYTSTDPSGTDKSQDITEYSGGVSLGFHGGLGVDYALSDKLSLFGEIAANYQNYAPSKAVLTTSTYNGIDQLPNMSTSQKEIEFVDSYTETSGTPPSAGSPSQSTKIALPFSSVGINIGLIFTMGSSGK